MDGITDGLHGVWHRRRPLPEQGNTTGPCTADRRLGPSFAAPSAEVKAGIVIYIPAFSLYCSLRYRHYVVYGDKERLIEPAYYPTLLA